MSVKKRFFTSHAKSSAAFISLGIHAILIVVALSFVAVTVITKEDQVFEAKPVNRPKMQLKKLQVPVNIKKKKTQKPKLRKRIVVQPKLNQTMPDIKMPEITGVKGGLGNGVGDGLGGAGSLGFSMPEIEIFGIKGKGEKIFLILDTGNHMLIDQMGGIPAYTIIKEELIRIVDSLPPTALVNVAVFSGNSIQTAFPKLVPANRLNAKHVEEWLAPLNSSANAAKSGRYGLKTLGSGGSDQREDLRIGKFEKPMKKGGGIYGGKWIGDDWYTAVMLAHKQQADTIFLLTNDWGYQRVVLNKAMDVEDWIVTTSEGRKWNENVQKARELLIEENAKRKGAGQPPKVISDGRYGLISTYFPDSPRPPNSEYYYFKPGEFSEAFLQTREKYKPHTAPTMSGLNKRRRKKIDFSFNVVQFVEKDDSPSSRSVDNFKKLTGLCKGGYETVSGLEEIQSYINSGTK
jgi:hypothetical protein